MESHYIDKIPERETHTYHFSQHDSNRTIRCVLYDGVKAVNLTGSEAIRMRYEKPNGDIGSIGVTNTSSTYVDIVIPAILTDMVGKIYCKLKVDGIGYKAFYIDVEADV